MKDSIDINLYRAALAAKGMTQEELAKKLGITPFSLYSKVVKRGGDFRKDEILILYSIFGKKVVDGFLF